MSLLKELQCLLLAKEHLENKQKGRLPLNFKFPEVIGKNALEIKRTWWLKNDTFSHLNIFNKTSNSFLLNELQGNYLSLISWQHNKNNQIPSISHRHQILLSRYKRKLHVPLTHSKTSQHLPGVPSPRETIWGTEPASHMGKPHKPERHSHLKPKKSKENPISKWSHIKEKNQQMEDGKL